LLDNPIGGGALDCSLGGFERRAYELATDGIEYMCDTQMETLAGLSDFEHGRQQCLLSLFPRFHVSPPYISCIGHIRDDSLFRGSFSLFFWFGG
jgi:hypothetical protein